MAAALGSLLITLAIFGIVWQSAKAVITRSLDGVRPDVVEEIRHAAEHVPGIERVIDAKARWLGHRLRADVTIAVDEQLPLTEANAIAAAMRATLHDHFAPLDAAMIQFGSRDEAAEEGNGSSSSRSSAKPC